ncbi:MAG TPA: tetratricopeptide repeat protein [Planctomycetota bacterium]|nr:tetratricopeptide repeat protein [Planctomycetota bacterium]
MRRLTTVILAVVVGVLTAEVLCAQEKKDQVVLQEEARTRRISGRVLEETWKTVTVDTDWDGVADGIYEADKVRRIEYADRPRYMLEAILLKRKPPELIVKLGRAYMDDATPRHIRQHAYYDIADAWARIARTDVTELPKAVEAYEKLFREIPDSRYAVTGRIELGNLLLEMGKGDEAIRQFEALTSGKFGAENARLGKLRVARAELALKRYDRAEKILSSLATSTPDVELNQEVKLLSARSMVGQGKYDEAHRTVTAVLAQKPTEKVRGMAYCVLGDLFAGRGQPKVALTAYLKVSMMYPETDSTERARAGAQAVRLLEELGRTEEAKELKRSLSE